MHDERILRAFALPSEPLEAAGPDPVEEAYARGLREGREQAQAEFDVQRGELRRELAESLGLVAELERQILSECESKMIELALEAATRIVRERIDAGDPVAQRAVREALETVPSGRALTVRVHAEDVDGLREALASDIDDGRLVLTADRRVSRGGCLVDSPAGTVDGSVETAMESVAEEARG